MFQIKNQIDKKIVNLFPSSNKIHKSKKRSILGHRTSGNRVLNFYSFFSVVSVFFTYSYTSFYPILIVFFQCYTTEMQIMVFLYM